MRRFLPLLLLISPCLAGQEAAIAGSLRPQLERIARRRHELILRLRPAADPAHKAALDQELRALDHYEVLLRDSIQTLTALDDARSEESAARAALAESGRKLAGMVGEIEKRLAEVRVLAAAPAPQRPAAPPESPTYTGVWAMRAEEDRSEGGPSEMQLEMRTEGDRITGTGKAVFGGVRIEGALRGGFGPAHAVVTLLDSAQTPVLTLRIVPGVRSIEVLRLESAIPEVQSGGPDVLWKRGK